jgi:hypothetical protein
MTASGECENPHPQKTKGAAPDGWENADKGAALKAAALDFDSEMPAGADGGAGLFI